jgi:hypothetical protein
MPQLLLMYFYFKCDLHSRLTFQSKIYCGWEFAFSGGLDFDFDPSITGFIEFAKEDDFSEIMPCNIQDSVVEGGN